MENGVVIAVSVIAVIIIFKMMSLIRNLVFRFLSIIGTCIVLWRLSTLFNLL